MNMHDIRKVIMALVHTGWLMRSNAKEAAEDTERHLNLHERSAEVAAEKFEVIIGEQRAANQVRFWQVEYIQDVAGDSQKVLYSCTDMRRVIDHIKADASIRVVEERLDGYWWYGTTDRGKRIVIMPAHVNTL